MMQFFAALILPTLLLILTTMSSIRQGINLGDEGYLVYGTQAVLRGEVPIRDFRAYDPARYYWCALWFKLIGPGFITTRIAMTFVSMFSLILIVAVIIHASGDIFLASITACLSLIWMRPIHKQIEVFFSILCCITIYALLSGDGYTLVLGGICGLIVIFGLNIVLYYFVAAALALLVSAGVQSGIIWNVGAPFMLGFFIAFFGLIAISALIPNFIKAYLNHKILPILRRKTSNLPLPKPWLWSGHIPQFTSYSFAKGLTLRCIFTFLPIIYILGIVFFLTNTTYLDERMMVLAFATSCTGITYYHHVLSRADLAHMYQTIHPFLILSAMLSQIIFGELGAIIVVGVLIAVSISVLLDEPNFILGSFLKKTKECFFKFRSDKFLLPQDQIDHLESLHKIILTHTTQSDRIFSAPNIPGYLALFERRTAVYDTFPIYPASPEAQKTMLAQFVQSAPKIAIISKSKTDNREDLLFEKNYADVFDFIQKNYDLVFSGKSETVYAKRQ